MDRRKFLTAMIGGVATAAAVRTFPFRVFSFPKEVLRGSPESEMPLVLEYRVNPFMPENEVWLVQEGRSEVLQFHEGPKAGQQLMHWVREPRKPRIFRIVNLSGNFRNLERFPYPGKLYTPFAPRSSD